MQEHLAEFVMTEITEFLKNSSLEQDQFLQLLVRLYNTASSESEHLNTSGFQQRIRQAIHRASLTS